MIFRFQFFVLSWSITGHKWFPKLAAWGHHCANPFSPTVIPYTQAAQAPRCALELITSDPTEWGREGTPGMRRKQIVLRAGWRFYPSSSTLSTISSLWVTLLRGCLDLPDFRRNGVCYSTKGTVKTTTRQTLTCTWTWMSTLISSLR